MKLTLDAAIIIFAGLLSAIQISIFAYFLANNATDNLPLIIFLIIAPLVNILALARKSKKG